MHHDRTHHLNQAWMLPCSSAEHIAFVLMVNFQLDVACCKTAGLTSKRWWCAGLVGCWSEAADHMKGHCHNSQVLNNGPRLKLSTLYFDLKSRKYSVVSVVSSWQRQHVLCEALDKSILSSECLQIAFTTLATICCVTSRSNCVVDTVNAWIEGHAHASESPTMQWYMPSALAIQTYANDIWYYHIYTVCIIWYAICVWTNWQFSLHLEVLTTHTTSCDVHHRIMPLCIGCTLCSFLQMYTWLSAITVAWMLVACNTFPCLPVSCQQNAVLSNTHNADASYTQTAHSIQSRIMVAYSHVICWRRAAS